MYPSWHFREMSKKEMNVDPTEEAFFTTETLSEAAASLARECYQNTMDAVKEGQTARIRIFFSGEENSLASEIGKKYLGELPSHIEANDLPEIPSFDNKIKFIVIEDFGTNGLRGKIEQTDDEDDGEYKNDFYYFWRNIGRSGKKDTDLGRWGLGKTVFPATSRISTFWGLTVRSNDGKRFLMGQSILKIHKMNDTKFAPYGHFALNVDDLPPMPCDDDDYITEFCKDFHLKRNGEPGLSIVIPYPAKDISGNDVILSALQHYFYPILEDRLIVDVEYAGKTVSINQNTILDLMEASFPDDQKEQAEKAGKLCDLAAWNITLPDKDYVVIQPAGADGYAPKWKRELFSEEQLTTLQKKFERGDRIAIKAPIYFKRKNEDKTTKSYFNVILQRDKNIGKSISHFIRNEITISGIRGFGSRKGVLGIVVIDEKELSGLLGDSENPAHTEWQYKSKKFQGKYENGASILRYVIYSLGKITDILSKPVEGLHKDLLKDIFSIDANEMDDDGDKDSGGKGGEPPPPPPPPPPPKPKYFILSKIESGFRVIANEDESTPEILNIHVAYEVRKGNPFKKWSPYDFDFGNDTLKHDIQNAELLTKDGNHLKVKVKTNGFSLKVTGFDKNRDIRVRLTYDKEVENA